MEVLYNGEWGTVCDNHFDDYDADVICKMLNFTDSTKVYKAAHFGEGVGPIWLDNLDCEYGETDVGSCRQNSIGINDCDHTQDVGVTCSGGS